MEEMFPQLLIQPDVFTSGRHVGVSVPGAEAKDCNLGGLDGNRNPLLLIGLQATSLK